MWIVLHKCISRVGLGRRSKDESHSHKYECEVREFILVTVHSGISGIICPSKTFNDTFRVTISILFFFFFFLKEQWEITPPGEIIERNWDYIYLLNIFYYFWEGHTFRSVKLWFSSKPEFQTASVPCSESTSREISYQLWQVHQLAVMTGLGLVSLEWYPDLGMSKSI